LRAHVSSLKPSPRAGTLPELPDELWAHILEHRAAINIQAHYKGYKVRIGPLRWVLKYIRKGVLVQTRAAYHCVEQQSRGAMHVHAAVFTVVD